VRDPPHLVEAKKHVGRLDSIGLGLIAVGLGALEVVLDKGQEEDWFASHFILVFAAVAAAALIAFVVWEWKNEHPIVEVRLLANRSFAVTNLMMLALGIALFGSTVLLPQYVQTWMGYSAQDAGMALSPGGVVVILLMPFVGRMIGRVDTRILIGFGFTLLSIATFHMAATLYPGVDFRTVVLLRIFQTAGIAFLFVPINTSAYAGIPPEKSNQVSGIVNLARNMGGDIGIALVTTMIARRSQVHQAQLVSHGDYANPALHERLQGIASSLVHAGSSAADAAHTAYGAIYRQVLQQAQTLAYLDTLFVLACITSVMVPAVLLTRKATGRAQVGH
jgi:DHA2 family multidrug resistance protein